MISDHNKSSDEIERDVEQTRTRVTETLDELRARMSPGQLLDEVIGYTRDTGGGKMMQNLGRAVQDNPAPLLLIGAGIVWMMTNGSSSRRYDRGYSGYNDRNRDDHYDRPATSERTFASERESWSDAARNTSAQVSDGVASVAGQAADAARRAGGQISEGISSMGDFAAEAASGLRDSTRRTVHDMRDAAHRISDATYGRTREMRGTISNMFQEQPLVLGAFGLAVGAALGAALPETEAEDRLMGETSDAIKERVGTVASDTYEKAKTVAEKTFAKVASEAEAQGLTAENAGDLISDVGSKAGAVFDTFKETALEEAERQGLTGENANEDNSSRKPQG